MDEINATTGCLLVPHGNFVRSVCGEVNGPDLVSGTTCWTDDSGVRCVAQIKLPLARVAPILHQGDSYVDFSIAGYE